MITNEELLELGWSFRTEGCWFSYINGDWFYQLYTPAHNVTRTYFQISHGTEVIYSGKIPDKETMKVLMNLLAIEDK